MIEVTYTVPTTETDWFAVGDENENRFIRPSDWASRCETISLTVTMDNGDVAQDWIAEISKKYSVTVKDVPSGQGVECEEDDLESWVREIFDVVDTYYHWYHADKLKRLLKRFKADSVYPQTNLEVSKSKVNI